MIKYNDVNNNKLMEMNKFELRNFIFDNLPLIYHGDLNEHEMKQCAFRVTQACLIITGEGIGPEESYKEI